MPDDSPSDDSLLALAGQGDRRAFAVLCDRHVARLLALAERLLGRAAEADDIVQETLLRAWNKAPGWQAGEARFSTWLHRVAVNLCLDERRRPRTVPLEQVAEPAHHPRSDEQIDQQRRRQRIDGAIDRLPQGQRTAMILLYQQELTRTEAAQAMDLPQTTFDSLAARARQGLKRMLAQ